MSNVTKQNPEQAGKAVYINPKIATSEAARCLLCYDAPCSKSCPAGTDPAKFIRSIRFRNIKGAAEIIRERNPLGAVCAHVCPHDQYCEKACSIAGLEYPIRIGMLQRFVVQQEKAYGMQILKAPETKKNKKVACIGAGPSSLTVAAKLAVAGYDVTIFEKEAKAGGMMRYGIAPVRLPEEIIDFDLEQINKLGVKFKFNKKVSLKDVDAFDAVFVGIGLWGFTVPKMEGSELEGNYSAVGFLKKFRTDGPDFVKGKRVVVIGGGDVAIDCAITAKSFGAADAKIVYRRTLEEAPGMMREFRHAIRCGISVMTEMAPVMVTGNGKAEAVYFKGYKNKILKMTLAADIVVFATGMKTTADDDMGLREFLNKDGFIKTHFGRISGKYFAAGDAVHGARSVVEAVQGAKEAVLSIKKFLEREA